MAQPQVEASSLPDQPHSRLDKVRRYLRLSTKPDSSPSESKSNDRDGVQQHQNGDSSWFPLWTSDNGTVQQENFEEECPLEEEGRGIFRYCDTILLVLLFAFSVVIAKLYYNYSTEVHLAAHQSTVWATTLVTNASMPSSATAKALAASTVELAHSVGSAAGAVASKATAQASWLWLQIGWLLVPVLSGMALTAFSWLILYLDSAVPGQLPPSPFTPSQIWTRSGYTFHLNYVATALNGVALTAMLFLGGFGL